MSVRHYIAESDLTANEFRQLIDRAHEFRDMWARKVSYTPLKNHTLAMIFEKSSTRTRVSFEAGITQLGGDAIYLSPADTHLGRGEPYEDTARVLSQMVDIIMVRTFSHEGLETFAQHSDIPVMNALTDLLHPCQLLADMQTFFKHRGDIAGGTVTWVGDGNNVCNSYINTAKLLGFTLKIAVPEGFEPNAELMAAAGSSVQLVDNVKDAVEGADLVVTDVWASMGQEQEQKERLAKFADYTVDKKLMSLASKDALFMHCLPAHRGEEVSAEVLDAPDTVVWEEAGNRLHAQKALMEFLLLG